MENITMLGVSNSGKTCFIYAMYDFMQKVQNGFSFLTTDPDVDMDLNEGWESIAFDGIWPNGTQATSYYDFTVLFKSHPIMDFSWCDYRGGAITSRSTATDVQELHERILDSECLIICIGADTIKEIIAGNNRKGGELVRLNQMILRYATSTQKRIPVIFALTKADLYTVEEQPKLIGILKSYFSNLYQKGSGWLHAVVPVSLGKFDDSDDIHISGVVAPKNIHIPVMLFLRFLLKEQMDTIKDNLEEISSNRVKHRVEILQNQQKTWWDKFLDGDNTDYLKSEIEDLNDEERNNTSQLSDLEKVFDNMKDMFKVCKVFYEDQPITI